MFLIRVRPPVHRGCSVVELRGELDIAGAVTADGLLMTVTASESVTILDLAELNFMDCSGLGVLVRARRHAGQFGHELLLASPGSLVRQVLELTGVARLFPTYASVAAAADPALVPESAIEHWRNAG
jgi:anti-anti-sigma factor